MNELPRAYVAKDCEPKWRNRWEESGVFRADPFSKKPAFCLMMPPPNVTGVLHMGHALVSTLQDILIRWKKMKGFETLWVPGTDHAGIATQTVVERDLFKSHGKRRFEFSRDEFLQHVWDWKEKSQGTILGQLRAIGCGCDWSRLRFTLDDSCSLAVRHMFKKLYDHGLIYRGNYLVNWDPVSVTALADDEVEYEERKGSLWTIRYPIVGGDLSLHVSTTRPETMLGDTAVAVHPSDERYRSLIGLEVDHPITGRRIPIIPDEFVDPEFGTGVVKVTPAHDPNDYQVALRSGLPMINIFTKDGKINEEGAPFTGLSILDARRAIVSTLEKQGFLTRVEPYTNRVGVSYRSKATIEPMLSEQWFIKMSAFKDTLREYVETKKVLLTPSQLEATYFEWIDNLRDWCISRQLWWGHRIPVYYRKDDPSIMVCYEGDGLPEEVKKEPDAWVQDPDVLDTWFSSALWPFSTLGWPHKTAEMEKFYPNATLITGNDILFFWVARMIMMGHFATGKPPFHEVFLHGLIYGKSYWRDQAGGGIAYVSHAERKSYDLAETAVPPDVKSRWEKMSKSKGNIIDPIEIIDEYGADAMRMALASSTTDASQIDLDLRRFEEFRHFTNKIWNGARFVLTSLFPEDSSQEPLKEESIYQESLENLPLEDRWILSRLSQSITRIEQALERYAFDKAANAAYDFYWNDFCAFYVEMAKPALSGKCTIEMRRRKQVVLFVVLMDIIRLLHPFAPFITEELFSIIRERLQGLEPALCLSKHIQATVSTLKKTLLATTEFPDTSSLPLEDRAEIDFQCLQDAIGALRTIRGEMKIARGVAIDLFVIGSPSSSTRKLLEKEEVLLRSLIKTNKINYAEKASEIPLASKAPLRDVELIVPLPEEMKEGEKLRVKKTVEKLRITVERTEKQLQSASEAGRAPLEFLQTLRSQLEQQKNELKILEEQLQLLS
jgi:valyl-tRNA synthetase